MSETKRCGRCADCLISYPPTTAKSDLPKMQPCLCLCHLAPAPPPEAAELEQAVERFREHSLRARRWLREQTAAARGETSEPPEAAPGDLALVEEITAAVEEAEGDASRESRAAWNVLWLNRHRLLALARKGAER